MSSIQPMPLPWTVCVLELEGPTGKNCKTTPLQYQIRALSLPDNKNIIAAWCGNDAQGHANAEFICKACNNHDELVAVVEALLDCRYNDYTDAHYVSDDTRDRARAILDKAKEAGQLRSEDPPGPHREELE